MSDRTTSAHGHEASDVDARVVALAVVVIGLILVTAMAALLPLRHGRPVAASPAGAEPPLLQDPVRTLSADRSAARAKLDGYGWVDRAEGVAHIPVERAIEMLASRKSLKEAQ